IALMAIVISSSKSSQVLRSMDEYDYSPKLDPSLICRWSGRSPFCFGACDDSFEWTFMHQKTLADSYTEQERTKFGWSCLIGEKTLCCTHKRYKELADKNKARAGVELADMLEARF
ncbi:hypothetical protein PFISCL1PPCAC_28162, partial [Pristionchus fissidentatus]